MKVSRTVSAPRLAAYAAFMDPQALAAWLPPTGMSGVVERFDAREGGGYRMTLTYDRPSSESRGKTTEQSDTVDVRFVQLVPGQRIVQAADFVSDDPANAGTMSMTWTFADAPGGTEVTVSVDSPPPGIRPEDHEAGIRSSLDNLAAYLGS